jgi:hypothetical protein
MMNGRGGGEEMMNDECKMKNEGAERRGEGAVVNG